jgi:hypothetical protein
MNRTKRKFTEINSVNRIKRTCEKKKEDKRSFRFDVIRLFIVMTITTAIDPSSYLQTLDNAKFSRFHIRAIVVSGAVSLVI